MFANKPFDNLSFGNHLVDDISLSINALNLLFGALLLTAIGVFVGANLLLLEVDTLRRSAQIAWSCFGLLMVFYAISYNTRSLIWGLIVTYGTLWLLVYSRLDIFVSMFYLIFIASGYITIRFLRIERKNWLSVLLMAVIAVFTILALTMQYTSFDMLPRLHTGNVHQDTLFHASISAMIKNYGISSTGLHGLVETPYHVFSHALMAGISLISGMGVIEVYGVANSVLFSPVLIFCITAFCTKLDQTRQLSIPLIWTITALLLLLLPHLFTQWALWDSYFASESYIVSLGLLMLGFALLFKRQLVWFDLVTVLLVAVMVANAKASVGLIFAGLWFARFVFLGTTQRFYVLGAAALVAFATGWVVLGSVQASAETMPIDPLHFIRNFSFLGTHLTAAGKSLLGGSMPSAATLGLALVAVGSFYLLHFGVSWIVIGRVIYSGGMQAVLRSPLAVYSLAALMVGAAISSLFAIAGGSAYYFSNVAFFISLPGLIVLATHWTEKHEIRETKLFLVAIVISSLLGAKYFYMASLFNNRYENAQHSELVGQLQQIRADAPLNIVWQTSAESGTLNPVTRCTAQPFLYTAVSERAWVGVIQNNNCDYYAYGYRQYGITDKNKKVNGPPALLQGMTLKTAPI